MADKHAAPSQAGAAIDVHDLRKTYAGDVKALQGLSFTVKDGTVFALLGPNGAGKSTAVKILTTLSRPDSGSATVAGINVLAHPKRVRELIGVVAQKSGSDPDATGRENLMLQGQLYGMRGRLLSDRVSDLLERFGLSEAAGRLVREYSGGMRRRLDVAMGLIHRPQVLFLDEPTTGLDPDARATMWKELESLASADRLTILLTTHYLEEADRLANRVAIIDRGAKVVEGTPDELKAQLRGDAIHVELRESGADGNVSSALAELAGVREVISIDGKSFRTRVDSGATAVPTILAALEGRGIGVASVTVSRPSLDDVYLRHTGRAFSEGDAPSEEKKS